MASINYVDKQRGRGVRQMSMFVYVGVGGGRGLVYVEKFPKICSLFIRKNSENRAFLLHMYIFFYRNHEISVKILIKGCA